MRKIFKLLRLIKNLPAYFRQGGVVYAQVGLLQRGESLKGRKTLITGGTSGIGFAIAKKFISEGADVLITGRSEARLNEALKVLGQNAQGLVWDVADFSVLQNKIKVVIDRLGGLDILVNNAGVASNIEIEELDENIYDHVMDTNLKAILFISKHACPYLIKSSHTGKIVNISSIAGLQGYSKPYGLSKSGVNSFTKGMAIKLLNKNVIVNAIAPGNTATPMTNIGMDNNIYDTLGKNKRAALPEEMAELAAFLASDAANNIVGQVIVSDGGATLI